MGNPAAVCCFLFSFRFAAKPPFGGDLAELVGHFDHLKADWVSRPTQQNRRCSNTGFPPSTGRLIFHAA